MPTTEATATLTGNDTVVVTAACQVCREDVALADTVALRACGHRFCAMCITGFLNTKIQEGDVQLRCFHQIGELSCGVAVEVADVEALVNAEMVAKYHKFLLLQSIPQARSCPFCEHTQVTTAGAQEPECVCEGCARIYCFTHGNAHAENVTCAQYDKHQSRAEKRSGRRVKKIARPCPKCARPIERNGGCAHMTCRVCKAQFCWHCGTKWGFDTSAHNSLLSLDGCDGAADVRAPLMDSSNVWVRRLGKTLYYLFLTSIGWPLTLALCWAWMPYTIVKENRAIIKRACVLARCFAISAMLGIILCVGVLVIAVVETLEFLVKMCKDGIKKLKQCFRRCCCHGNIESRTAEKTDVAMCYVGVRDASTYV